jgi:NitT/TauT family transport system substrate-binding protein
MYLVKEDSPIRTTADLLGKKVGVVTVGGACDYLLNDDIRKKGLDYKTVAYTPIGVPDMAPTLLRGGIDAACIPEPILPALKAQGGLRPIMDAFAGENNNWPIVGFSVTEQFADANPNTVAALRRALEKALKMANQNPDTLRELYPTYTTLKPEDAKKIAISFNPPESDFKRSSGSPRSWSSWSNPQGSSCRLRSNNGSISCRRQSAGCYDLRYGRRAARRHKLIRYLRRPQV